MTKVLFTVLIVAGMSAAAQTNLFPSSGNVRINTSNSDANLTSNGTLLVSGGSANLDPNNSNSGFNNLANSGKLLIGWNRSAGEGETDFISNKGPGSTGGFSFYDYSNTGVMTNLMRITPDGKVRIKEVKVETANWPDYVFNPTYKLLSLQQTQTFIQQNGHLPDMPSAAEIEKNGQNLGELNAKLLQKIEELTLHLIVKDQELKTEKTRNDRQQEQLMKLIAKVGKIEKRRH